MTVKATFIEPMLLLRAERLPEGAKWAYELKLDGYRALAIKSGGKVQLRSRNNKDFSRRYPAIVEALAALPDDTVLDGEVVALAAAGRPSFNLLQNIGDAKTPIVYYVFDVLVVGGGSHRRKAKKNSAKEGSGSPRHQIARARFAASDTYERSRRSHPAVPRTLDNPAETMGPVFMNGWSVSRREGIALTRRRNIFNSLHICLSGRGIGAEFMFQDSGCD